MLEKVRKPFRAKSVFSYIIFSIICLVFVFIGVPIGQRGTLSGGAAMVNNEVISWAEYQNYLDLLQNRTKPSQTNDLSAERQKQIQQSAVQALINTELVLQAVRSAGLPVSDQAVQERIVSVPVFQEEGRFVRARYYAFLESRKWSAGFFEDKIRKEIQAIRFQNFLTQFVWPALAVEEHAQQLALFKVRVSYLSFPSADLTATEFLDFETKVKDGGGLKLKQMIKNRNWKWENTGEFDLSRFSLPYLPSHKRLFDEVAAYLPQTGLIPKVMRIRDQSFILKVDQFRQVDDSSHQAGNKTHLPKAGGTNPPPNSKKEMEFFNRRLAGHGLFLSWMQSARANAKIKIDPRINP